MDWYVKREPAYISLGFMPKGSGYYKPSNIFYNVWKVRMASNLNSCLKKDAKFCLGDIKCLSTKKEQ